MSKRNKISNFNNSSFYNLSEKYDILKITPYINLSKIKFEYTNNIDKLVKYLSNQKNKVVYLKTEINIKYSSTYILEINNLNNMCKIWVNKCYVGFYTSYSNRLELKLNKGRNEILIEVIDLNRKISLILEKKTNKAKINKVLIQNNFDDIRKFYIVASKRIFNCDNKVLSYLICSDFAPFHNDYFVELCISKYINSEMVIFDTIKAKIYEKRSINLNKFENGEIFLTIKDGNTNFYGGLINIFIGDEKEIIDQKKDEILHMLNESSQKVFYLAQYNRIINKEISDFTKLYLLKRLKNYIVNKESNVIPLLYKSIYDTFSQLYVSCNNMQIKKVIIFLSSSSSITYLYNYIADKKDDELFVECYIRSSSFGNIIVENVVLEALNVLKSKYDLSNAKIYLFGYSSCASASLMIISRYPQYFDGVVSFGGEFNEKLIINALNKKIWFIMGNNDEFYPRINKYLNNLMIHKNNWKKIILKNINHATLALEITRKQYLRTFIEFQNYTMKASNLKYYFDIPYYVNNNKYSVLSCNRNNYSFVLLKNNILKSRGVSELYIKDKGIKIESKIVKANTILPKHKLFNGLGFYNIYTKKILYYAETKDDEKLINNFIIPKNLSNNSTFDIFTTAINKQEINFYSDFNYIIATSYIQASQLNSDIRFELYGESFIYNGIEFLGPYAIINIIYFEPQRNYILYIFYNDYNFAKKCFFIDKFRINTDVRSRGIYSSNTTFIYTTKGYYYLNEEGEINEFI